MDFRFWIEIATALSIERMWPTCSVSLVRFLLWLLAVKHDQTSPITMLTSSKASLQAPPT